jgi:hypothetical protein
MKPQVSVNNTIKNLNCKLGEICNSVSELRSNILERTNFFTQSELSFN